MTDAEFRTWTRHTAENLIAQRDEAIARIDRHEVVQKDRDEAHRKALDEQRIAHETALVKLSDECDARLVAQAESARLALSAKESELAACKMHLLESQRLCEALGGTEVAQRLVREKQRDELRQQIAASKAAAADAERKLAELERV